MEYSGKGPSGVWILTARPLKQGISNTNEEQSFDLLRLLGLEAKRTFVSAEGVGLRLNGRHETYTVSCFSAFC